MIYDDSFVFWNVFIAQVDMGPMTYHLLMIISSIKLWMWLKYLQYKSRQCMYCTVWTIPSHSTHLPRENLGQGCWKGVPACVIVIGQTKKLQSALTNHNTESHASTPSSLPASLLHSTCPPSDPRVVSTLTVMKLMIWSKCYKHSHWLYFLFFEHCFIN